MNGESVLVLFLFIGILIIILLKKTPSKKNLRQAHEYENQGRYLDALDYYSRHSLEEAAKMVLRAPEASQVLALRRLEKKFPYQSVERAFIHIARSNLMKDEPQTAAQAFVLAKKPFAAAKVYIDTGGLEYIPAAVQILDKNVSLLHDRNQAIRNLAKYAYNNRKFMEAAELLRTIGAEEEANAVLIAAATEMRKRGLNEAAKQYLTSASQPEVAIQHYLNELKDHLRNGDIEKMRRSLAITKDIAERIQIDKKNSEKKNFLSLIKEIDEFDRLLKILDSARDILRKKNTNQAIALYDELLESLGSNVPASIYAEAALANEEKNPQYAAELYQKAAKRVKSPRAAESFRMRAKKLEIVVGREPSVTKDLFKESLEEEYCSVCRMRIANPINLIRCPECGSPAHYGHLAEWIKIRGVCPICKKKIKITRPKEVTI